MISMLENTVRTVAVMMTQFSVKEKWVFLCLGKNPYQVCRKKNIKSTCRVVMNIS